MGEAMRFIEVHASKIRAKWSKQEELCSFNLNFKELDLFILDAEISYFNCNMIIL